MANMGKHVRAIGTKQDNLWVKWIHSVYLKYEDWWEYPPVLVSVGIGVKSVR